MERVFHGLHWKTLLLYLDDVIIIGPRPSRPTWNDWREVLKRLQGAGLKLKPGKCELLQEKVRYLGHVVSKEGVATDPDKIADIRMWHPPGNIKELQAFLGTAGYYRQYLKRLCYQRENPHKIDNQKKYLGGGTTRPKTAFEKLKKGLVTAPVLGISGPDPRLYFRYGCQCCGSGSCIVPDTSGKRESDRLL